MTIFRAWKNLITTSAVKIVDSPPKPKILKIEKLKRATLR